MNIDADDLGRFEVTITKLYDNRIARRTERTWIECLTPDQPSLTELLDAWQMGKVLIYSPEIDAPAIGAYYRDMLGVLLSIKHAELKEGFTLEGRQRVFRALASDVLEVYGVTEHAFCTIRIMEAVLIGPALYMRANKHYPPDEKAWVLTYANISH